jgi:hypothetical protein
MTKPLPTLNLHPDDVLFFHEVRLAMQKIAKRYELPLNEHQAGDDAAEVAWPTYLGQVASATVTLNSSCARLLTASSLTRRARRPTSGALQPRAGALEAHEPRHRSFTSFTLSCARDSTTCKKIIVRRRHPQARQDAVIARDAKRSGGRQDLQAKLKRSPPRSIACSSKTS